MKQFLLLFILSGLLVASSQAATVSGLVSNSGTGCPVAVQRVYLYDSLINYTDSALTNASGSYTIPLPAAVATGHPILVYTIGCGVVKNNHHIYSGSNITSNFSICSGTPVYTLHGTVSLAPVTNTGLARVYLIRQSYDTALAATVLNVIDSITTSSVGGSYSKTYSSIPQGHLLLKAALLPSHPLYNNYLPTYDTNKLVWNAARQLDSLHFHPCVSSDINMTAGIYPGGPGFIGGSVLVGANKQTAVGDPLPNKIILLTDINNIPLSFRYTDSGGKFNFSNLAYGTYKLFGDAWGKINPALTVTITAAKPILSNIIFEENNTFFKGTINLAVANTSGLDGLTAYPNPVTDHVSISGLNSIGGSKTLTLSSIIGNVLYTHSFAAGQAVEANTANIAPGLYVIQVQTDAGNASFRILKQ